MLNKAKETLKYIKCCYMANELESAIERAKQNDLSYLEFINELLSHEIKNRKQTRIKRYQKMAHFPVIKTFDEFDFRFQTSITKKEINEWLTFTWLDQRQNKILMGAPGVGKTHLAIATGFSAVHKGYKVVFFSMQNLMEEMILADHNNKFNDFLKKLLMNDLIIIDELGYLPMKPIYANLFFQLVIHSYEYRSLMITSNKLFNDWGVMFGDQIIASAMLDRLMHHVEATILNGESYRMKR